jgi:hypothetical protein
MFYIEIIFTNNRKSILIEQIIALGYGTHSGILNWNDCNIHFLALQGEKQIGKGTLALFRHMTEKADRLQYSNKPRSAPGNQPASGPHAKGKAMNYLVTRSGMADSTLKENHLIYTSVR